MGIRNVNKIFTYWQHLGHREVRLLTYMCIVALDAATPPVYFGGWEAGAVALGLNPTEHRSNAKEAHRRCVAALVTAGAIVSSGHARTGNRAEYAVTLDPAVTYTPIVHQTNSGRPVIHWQDIAREDRGTQKVPHLPTEKVPQQGHPKGGNRGTQKVPPKRTEEELEEYGEESHHQVGHVTSPVDNSGQSQIEILDPMSNSARAYLNDRPGEHAQVMARARSDLGDDTAVTKRIIYAAALAGWKWKGHAA